MTRKALAAETARVVLFPFPHSLALHASENLTPQRTKRSSSGHTLRYSRRLLAVAHIVGTHSCRPGLHLSHRIVLTGRRAQSGARCGPSSRQTPLPGQQRPCWCAKQHLLSTPLVRHACNANAATVSNRSSPVSWPPPRGLLARPNASALACRSSSAPHRRGLLPSPPAPESSAAKGNLVA
jgi:hypothetical protein